MHVPAVLALVAVLAGCDPGDTAPPAAPPLMIPPAAPAPPWQSRPAVSFAPTPTVTRPGQVPGPTATSGRRGPPAAAATSTPGPCLPLYGPGITVPVDVRTAAATARMTWYHNGDPASIAYYVGVQRLDGTAAERAIRWTRIVPPRICRTLTVAVPGLTPGLLYTLWLDLESVTPEVIGGTTRRTLSQPGYVFRP